MLMRLSRTLSCNISIISIFPRVHADERVATEKIARVVRGEINRRRKLKVRAFFSKDERLDVSRIISLADK